MKHLVSILALITGCTAAVEDNHGDDTGGGGVGGTNGSGNATFTTTSIHDERLDQIDFTSGEPFHTHAGPEIVIGGKDCVDVFKHSYLMETPKFGREATPNPIAFTVNAEEFRVRRGGEVLADWSPVVADTITIGRALLGDREGTYYVDLRAGDDKATACWNHHPLAAPIEVLPAQPDASGLPGMKLPMDAPVSQLFEPATEVRLYTQHFIHYTAEPVTITLDLTPPTASFTRRAVEDYVVSATGVSGVICEDAQGPSGDPICTLPNQMPVSQASLRSGVLASASYSMTIIDLATGTTASNCAISNMHATCQLPPRTTSSALAYRIVLSIRNAAELAPAATGPYAEHTIAGLTFTGKKLEVARRCAQLVEATKFGVTIVTCHSYVEYTHMQALDSAQIMFSTMPIQINGKSYDAPAYVWDSGNDDLPGAE